MTDVQRTPQGLYFEEFEIGKHITTAGRTITEADVIAFVNCVSRLAWRHRKQLASLAPETIPVVTEKFQTFLRSVLRRRPLLDPELEIPEDVLA